VITLGKTKKSIEDRIIENSEKQLMRAIETAQEALDIANSALINVRAFYYHGKHAQEQKQNKR
jgi:hypothetical protein